MKNFFLIVLLFGVLFVTGCSSGNVSSGVVNVADDVVADGHPLPVPKSTFNHISVLSIDDHYSKVTYPIVLSPAITYLSMYVGTSPESVPFDDYAYVVVVYNLSGIRPADAPRATGMNIEIISRPMTSSLIYAPKVIDESSYKFIKNYYDLYEPHIGNAKIEQYRVDNIGANDIFIQIDPDIQTGFIDIFVFDSHGYMIYPELKKI